MIENEAPVAHGGALDEARLRHPFAPEPWIDLSTGVNPFPFPLPPISAELWARLPFAREDLELRRAAAIRYGAASAENIVAWKREGHAVCEVGTLAEALADAYVIIVVNPNNPTGRIIPVEDLVRAAHDLDQRRGFLVVDEAFMDVIEQSQSIIPMLPPSTTVLRSFGKMYGLAGARLGFAVTAEKIAKRLRDLLGPWAVPGPTIAIGRTALTDDAWLAQTRRRLVCDAERLDMMLARAGCGALGGTALFRLATHPFAEALARKLEESGILVRRFAREPTWLRFGIPGCEEAWRRLEQVICG